MIFRVVKYVLGFLLGIPLTVSGQESPPGGVSLIGGNFLTSFKLYSGSAAATKREKTITGQPFRKVAELSTHKETSNFWGAEYSTPLTRRVEKGGVALLRFYLRCTSSQNDDGIGVVQAYCQKASPDWDKSVTQRIVIGNQWKEFLIPFAFSSSYQPGAAMLAFGLGASKPQTLQLAGVELLYYGKKIKVDELPKSGESYAGRDSDAAWRIEAQNRINEIRKGDFVVQVKDANGLPVANADIRVEQLQHSFQFGSAVALWRLVSQTKEDKIYQQKFLDLFNAGGPENALKWQPWIGDWGSSRFGRSMALRGLRWLKDNEVPARGHVMVWPGWNNLPGLVSRHKDKPEPIPGIILKHIKDISVSTRKYVYEWDVLNEPYANHDLMDIFGRQIMVDWFKTARQHNPSSRLYLNDYGILSGGGMNAEHQDHYEETTRFLLRNKAPLGGLGFQGHFRMPLTPPRMILRLLDRYARLELPIKITEFDVDVADESLQADYTRDFLYAAFSHPSVSGIQLWGFWEKQHWRPNAALYRANWGEKPSGVVFRELTQKKWWTLAKGVSSKAGSFSGRGFYGTYRLMISIDGNQSKSMFQLEEDGQKLEAQLLGVDLRPDLEATAIANKKLMITWENTNPVKFGLQQSDDLIQWENVDEELPSDQSRPVIELPLNKAALFFRLIRLAP
jgi:GH35 family endo-1,4-beta-xylanase